MIDCIRAQRPDDGFLAEETLVEPERGHRPPPENDRVCWVIDPLDGTRNYIRGIPPGRSTRSLRSRPQVGQVLGRDGMLAQKEGRPCGCGAGTTVSNS